MVKNSNHSLRVELRFYGDLNGFLYSNHNGKSIERTLPSATSVKDLIEGCGIPHTEIDLILIDHHPVDFSYLVKDGDKVSVYPQFKSFDIDPSKRLLKPHLSNPSFVVDINLGKLSRYLRMAGFDTIYQNDLDDNELIDIMLAENRTLLTRDRKLLMHNVVHSGYLPRSDQPAEQLEEVLKRFGLFDDVKPYSRCMNCNGILESVSKEEIIDQLQPLTRKYFNIFSQCPDCRQIYWKGSHRHRLHPKIQQMLKMDTS